MSDLEKSISVIIPVFRAEQYVAAAVASVLQHPCVAEVLLIEDGSPDDSLSICQQLAEQYERVQLLTHGPGINKGAGPSRNLGIRNAISEWIAFLDADDFWLPERFNATWSTLAAHPDADGIYECLGIHYETPELANKWQQQMRLEVTTLSQPVAPEQLIYAMAPLGKMGWFSGDALLVKKSLLTACGMYSALPLNQDTELFMKLALKGRLYAGNIQLPVAVRRVHEHNRISAGNARLYANRFLLWKAFSAWCIREGYRGKLIRKVWWQWLKVTLVHIRNAGNLQQQVAAVFRKLPVLFRMRLLLRMLG